MPVPAPVAANVTAAFEALKRKDFAAARDAMAGEDMGGFAVPHFLIKGLAELALSDWAAARATFAAATAVFPDEALLWLNRGIAEENMGLTDAAIASQQKCVGIDPDQAEAHGNLANLYRKVKRFALSEKMARRAVELGAARGDACNSLGLALHKQGKFIDAEAAFHEAMRATPEGAPPNPFVLSNMANLMVDTRRFDEAWPLFAQAQAITDRAIIRRDEGLARLLAGDWARGWELYQARLDVPGALRGRPACPLWRGEDLRGKKLLILAEQGFGDVVHMCRYESFLPREGNVVWAVPDNMVRLLTGRMRGAVVSETSPLPDCDFYAPVFSLPLLTGHILPEPMASPWRAHATPALPAGTRTRKIGIIWAGSRTHERDYERSVPLSLLAPFVRETDVDFYAPFTGDALNDIGDLPIARLDHLIGDFADTAALIAQMDCVITVDTAVAHLAGAMGVKTYLLLPYCPDWRWGCEGDTTAWYPSMTLLRQPRYGDWGSAIGLLKRRFGKAA
ncbi:MAG: tetratricopeptide repeat protein [Alphaproteobacteria bacterium]|nr:tetratricopeptide repeat protein [Alphaproteobacteria bacterium]